MCTEQTASISYRFSTSLPSLLSYPGWLEVHSKRKPWKVPCWRRRGEEEREWGNHSRVWGIECIRERSSTGVSAAQELSAKIVPHGIFRTQHAELWDTLHCEQGFTIRHPFKFLKVSLECSCLHDKMKEDFRLAQSRYVSVVSLHLCRDSKKKMKKRKFKVSLLWTLKCN